MGVKPFYYAQIGSCVIFSNTLDCIRQHPRISDKLNDLAIADFVLFGFNQDSATTPSADIQRIHRRIASLGHAMASAFAATGPCPSMGPFSTSGLTITPTTFTISCANL
jgi:hypothetical protein